MKYGSFYLTMKTLVFLITQRNISQNVSLLVVRCWLFFVMWMGCWMYHIASWSVDYLSKPLGGAHEWNVWFRCLFLLVNLEGVDCLFSTLSICILPWQQQNWLHLAENMANEAVLEILSISLLPLSDCCNFTNCKLLSSSDETASMRLLVLGFLSKVYVTLFGVSISCFENFDIWTYILLFNSYIVVVWYWRTPHCCFVSSWWVGLHAGSKVRSFIENGLSDETLIILLKFLNKYLWDDSVKSIDVTSQTLQVSILTFYPNLTVLFIRFSTVWLIAHSFFILTCTNLIIPLNT